MKSVKAALLAGLLAFSWMVEADQAMPYCFHLDGNLYNEGTAEASSYKLTKTGSVADSFSTAAQYGGKSLQGGASNSYILTAATPGEALVSNAQGWTLSMWVNFNGGGYAWRDVAGFSIGNKFYQIQRTNINTYNIYGGSGTLSKEIPGKTTSDWVNIVFVMAAGSDKSVKIYADGGEVGTYSATDSLAGTGTAGLTSVSIGNQVLSGINNGTFSYYGRAQSGLIDEVAVYNFAANDEQIGYLAANAPSEELYGPIIQPDKTAYYQSGYIGDHASTATDALKLTETSGGTALEYNRTYGNWTIIIDENSPAGAQAWCADTVKYNGRTMKIVKVIIKRDFTFKPGVSEALFDGVELEVAEGAKLTLTNEGIRTMSVGAVTFSGAGTIDAATGVTFTKDVTVKGDVQVSLPSGTTYVAQVGDARFTTLAAALAAAGDEGFVEVLVNSLTGGNIPDSWRGTVQFSGTMPNEFVPSNYGNASSTIEFKGVSGGYIVHTSLNFPGTIKLTDDGTTPAWNVYGGFSNDKYPLTFGNLTGDGELKDSGSVNQPYVFKNASSFNGSLTALYKRFIVGDQVYTGGNGRIYVQDGYTLNIAAGKTMTAAGGIFVDGTIKGSGTLASATTFGDTAVIDGSEGALTAASTVTFGSTLTLKGAEIGDAILNCASAPTNLNTLELKDEAGSERDDWLLVYEAKKQIVRLYPANHEPMTLYWQDKAETFWEHVGDSDVHGNNGIMRDENGNQVIHRSEDTVVFDKAHYTSANWDYNENLYIKASVIPGSSNDWDLKILEGVTLKLGFCGPSASGQNLTQNFKIYIEEGSTLELGYWGNTHHKEGLLRENLTFGGAGTITLGDDMGSSCRVKGNIKVKGNETPTFDVRGKELVVQGGQIDVNLTGFGALSGSGTITTPITFNNATINATGTSGFTFKNTTTFTGTLTVDMARAPTGEELIKICTKGEGGSFVFTEGIDVLVRVNGNVEPAFYTLATDNDGNLCVKVAPTTIDYSATVRLGYDYKTMIVDVDMNPAIDGVVAEVTVADVEGKLQHWSAPVIGMRNQGRAEVMVGDADDNFAPGTYSMTVSVGSWQKKLQFTLEAQNGGDLATVGGVGYNSMREAVAAGGTIKLLTNVFFAPPPGDYTIERGEYDIFITNDMEMTVRESAVTITAPKIVDHYEIWTGYPFVIKGAWLGAALPWKTQKEIDRELDKKSANELKPFEAYVLGIPASEMGTASLIARGVQTNDPNTIEVTDGFTPKDAAETGVVVTKKLIDAETQAELSATTTYDLRNMDGKSKLLKLEYGFAMDKGQSAGQVDAQ